MNKTKCLEIRFKTQFKRKIDFKTKLQIYDLTNPNQTTTITKIKKKRPKIFSLTLS